MSFIYNHPEFERKVFRKICGTKGSELNGERKIYITRDCNLCESASVAGVMILRRPNWAGHTTWWGQTKVVYIIL
jgi:hypothetical protein